ncbi:unnamed protein product [Oikopleura dioica]|uniref:Uncharacterized protein n=1 Tax=Oikopleura dioica TaxID=34765 RepID=E4WRE6_OIKDI|nr:unnamed protein product [Oikopleura dioica]CBY35390.1 unnamed protein product [Oikopleura dioica]
MNPFFYEDQKFMTPNPSKLCSKHPREPLLWNHVLLSDVCLPLRRPIPIHQRELKPAQSSSAKVCSRKKSFPQKFGYGTYDCIRCDNSTRQKLIYIYDFSITKRKFNTSIEISFN